MYRNYLKTAIRNLLREKGSTLINLSGLTLGIGGSLILFLIISYHKSFDTFHSKKDRIYRVVNHSDGNNGKSYQSGVPTVLPDAFRLDFPEAEQVAFMSYRSNGLVTIPQTTGESKLFQEETGIVYTEPSFFKIFDRKTVVGDPFKALDEPNEAVISKKLALKYFGREDVIGELVKFNKQEYKINAIVEDVQSNSDLPFNLFLSYSTIKKEREEAGWNSIWSDEQCYVLLKEGESMNKLSARMPAFSRKYLGNDDPDKTEFFLQPLSDIHFDERFDTFTYYTISKNMLTAFAVIAVILVITACINFINLATAEAIKRSKEVGVRKSLGSTRAQLVKQFLGETSLVTFVAVLLAIGLVQVALSFLNAFLELNLSLSFTDNPYLWFYIGSITLFVSLMSGLYPAFVISGFNPAAALKNQINNKNSSGYTLRRTLVVVQFCISQLFIIGTIVIISQMNYFQRKDLGFRKEGILMISIPEGEKVTINKGISKMRTLREEVARIPGVEAVTLASAPPSSGNVSGTNFKVAGDEKDYETQIKQVDGNYIDVFKLDLLSGENLQDLDTATGYVVNERLARLAGFSDPKDIIGKEIRLRKKQLPVIGVVKDFHTVSLHEAIEPTVLFNRLEGFQTLSLKIDVNKAKQIISAVETKWKAAYPDHLFGYAFMDEDIRHFYDAEQRMSVLFIVFTSMAIFIGCLGLFGLATFMANQKTKEIGVRKVLGASVESIVFMFSKEYVKLIVLGFVFSAPLAWYIMDKFLSEFAYKIELGPGMFLLGLGITLAIAVLTVGYKSLKAAIVNPVKSLRYE
jgi:predicted permease